MRFSIRLNNDLPVRDYIRMAQLAEDAGFDQFWVSNDLFLRSAPAILAAVATQTKRIQLGSCIFNPYTTHPSELAMFAATMDELSDGRFNLGIAAGAGEFLKWVGLTQDKPLRAMRGAILGLRAMLRGQPAPPETGWTSEAYLRFTPSRPTPIYLGAMSEGMLRLAGELCDGVLPLLFPPEHYFGVRPLVDEGLAKRGVDDGKHFDFAACVWISSDPDRARAEHELAKKVAYYGHAMGPLIYDRLGLSQDDFRPIEHALITERNEAKAVAMVTPTMLRIGIVGDADDIVARLQPLIAAGVKHISFGPPLGPEPEQALRYLGSHVLPRLISEKA